MQPHVLKISMETRFSLNSVWTCLKNSNLNLCCARRKLYISYMRVLWSSEFMFQLVLGKNGSSSHSHSWNMTSFLGSKTTPGLTLQIVC